MNDAKDAYDAFWKSLLPAYPVSKGEFRLPIATNLIEIPNFNLNELHDNLTQILNTLLKTEGTKEKAQQRALSTGDTQLVPLIDDEYTGVVRFDCLWNPVTETVSILEINCDYPDGLLLHDKTVSVLKGSTNERHATLYEQLFEPKEDVAVLHSPTAPFVDGYHAVSEYLSASGHTGTILTDIATLTSHTTVQRCLETTKLTPADLDNLIEKSPRLINTAALRTLGYKNVLENISHPYIPTTFSISATTYEHSIARQNTLVLKPADGCEGTGIYFGNQMDAAEWKACVANAVENNYVAQEFIDIPRISIDMYEDGTVVNKELYYDICPHFFIKHGEVIGVGHTLMRFSKNPIVNVSQGGGIGYYKD